jgi:hypothetical protein
VLQVKPAVSNKRDQCQSHPRNRRGPRDQIIIDPYLKQVVLTDHSRDHKVQGTRMIEVKVGSLHSHHLELRILKRGSCNQDFREIDRSKIKRLERLQMLVVQPILY